MRTLVIILFIMLFINGIAVIMLVMAAAKIRKEKDYERKGGDIKIVIKRDSAPNVRSRGI